MTKPQHEFALDWLRKARNDLVTAKTMLAVPDGPTDTPCFHAQQAVEKSLKALMTSRGVEFPRSHDLMRLLDLASPTFSALARFRDELAQIADYAVDVRYPDVAAEPLREEAQAAYSLAERVCAFAADELMHE